MAVIGAQEQTFWPWFEDSGEDLTFEINSGFVHYGSCRNTTFSSGQHLDFLQNLQPGTYSYLDIGYRATDNGVISLSIDGGSIIGSYSKEGSVAANTRWTLTGLPLVPGILSHAIGIGADAGDYGHRSTFTRLVRTGE